MVCWGGGGKKTQLQPPLNTINFTNYTFSNPNTHFHNFSKKSIFFDFSRPVTPLHHPTSLHAIPHTHYPPPQETKKSIFKNIASIEIAENAQNTLNQPP